MPLNPNIIQFKDAQTDASIYPVGLMEAVFDSSSANSMYHFLEEYNVSAHHLNSVGNRNGKDLFIFSEAIALVPADYRHNGLTVTFKTDNNGNGTYHHTESWVFKGTSTTGTGWSNASNWVEFDKNYVDLADSSIRSDLSQLGQEVDRKIERLAWIGPSSSGKTDWQVGDKLFNTTRGKLAVCTSPSPSADFGQEHEPEYESLYIYEGFIYHYDGDTLVKVKGKKDHEVDLLNEYVNGKVVKIYNVTAGTPVDGTSLSSPNAIPIYIGKGCKFSVLKTSSVVSSLRVYGIDKNGVATLIGNVIATEVVFTAPVDMVAVGVYIIGGNISSNGTCTLTITKDALWETQKKVEELFPVVSNVEKDGYDIDNLPERRSFDSADFVRADLWRASLDTSITYRVAMSSGKIANKDIYLRAATGFRFAVHFYNSGEYVGDSGWRTEYIIPKNTEYRIKIARTTEDTSEVADINLFVSKVTFPSDFYSEFRGVGSLEYYGLKMPSLSLFPNKFNCKEEILVTENQGASVNQNTSGMAVCKGRAFCFGDTMEGGSKCTIFNLSDLSQVEVTLPWSAHNNNVQPTPFYYDSDDTYPLLLVSRGDYPGAGVIAQKFYFVRVVESGSSYIFTIVKEVSYSGFAGEQYNCSWFANYEKNKLYCYTYPNGGWSVTEDNPITIYKFDFPSMANYEPVSLTGADIKGKITLQDHWIMQAGLFHDGKFFIQTEADGFWDNLTINGEQYDASKGRHFLFVIDQSGYIETLVPLHGYMEQEGMCIYDGALYMSEKYRIAQPGNVCFQLVKYTFD